MKKIVVGAAACACCVTNAEFVRELGSDDSNRVALACVDKARDHDCFLQKNTNTDSTTSIDIISLIKKQLPLFFLVDPSDSDAQEEYVDILKDRWQSQDYIGEDENGWRLGWSKSIKW